jgi:hypothetical protein
VLGQNDKDADQHHGGTEGEGATRSAVEVPEEEEDDDDEKGGGVDDGEPAGEEENEEDEEDEDQAALLAKVKKLNVWEFHGVVYLALKEVRANGHIKGGGDGESKKGKTGKKKK